MLMPTYLFEHEFAKYADIISKYAMEKKEFKKGETIIRPGELRLSKDDLYTMMLRYPSLRCGIVRIDKNSIDVIDMDQLYDLCSGDVKAGAILC